MSNLTQHQRRENVVRLVALWYSQSYLSAEPLRTSSLTGKAWTQEILQTRPSRFIEICRMEKAAFKILLNLLIENGTLSAELSIVPPEESLMIFLYILGQNACNRNVQVRFQHSGETISRHFHKVLNGIVSLQSHFIQLPDENMVPDEIRSSAKFFPYFRNCIGAIDGTHLPVSVSEPLTPRFRNRKGYTSQNVLAACSFDMSFLYILAGWEGSAHDGAVLHNALQTNFVVPNGKYYLADAGYCLTQSFLIPYRGVRYHLKEWGYANQRYLIRSLVLLFICTHIFR